MFPPRGSRTNGFVRYKERRTAGESRLSDLSPGLSMKSKTQTPAEKTRLQRSRGRCIDGGMRSFCGGVAGCRVPCQEIRRESDTRAEPTAEGLDPAPQRCHASWMVLWSTSAHIKLIMYHEKAAVITGFEIHQNNPLRNYR